MMRFVLLVTLLFCTGELIPCASGFKSNPKNNQKRLESVTCAQKVDIILAIDSSGSIGERNYTSQMDFAARIARHFTIGPDNVRIAGLIFSDNVRRLFDLNRYSNADDIGFAFRRAPYLKEQTFTGKALNYIRDNSMFSDAKGARDAAKIVVVMSDGTATDLDDAMAAATKLKDDGGVILYLGIGNRFDHTEMSQLASSENDVLSVDNFDLLSSIENPLVRRTCDKAQ